MRAALPALVRFLATRQPWLSADLFTITLLSGTIIRLTSFDMSLSWGGQTWTTTVVNNMPTLTRSTWKMTNTTDVPEMTMTMSSTGTDYTGGQNIKSLAHQGLFDGASVLLQRAVMPTAGDLSLGLTTLFSGRVSSIEIDGLSINFTVRALATILQQYMPRNIYKAGCSWALYSTGCTLSRATHTATNTVAAGSTARQIALTGAWTLPDATHPAIDSLTLGTLTITSGAGAGQLRTIVGGTVTLVQIGRPLYVIPAPGDTVTAALGCNKTSARCAQLGNSQNYRGYDFIPSAETAF